MAAPEPVVQWSPSTDPFAPPVWLNISAYVLDVVTSRKKPALQGAVQAGTCDVTLRNNDGRFDPANTAGPYSGQLDLGKRVRVQGLIAGTYYPVIDVMVETIEVSWLSQSESIVRFSCADFFAVLARKRLARDNYRSMMMATVPAPADYCRMHGGVPSSSPTVSGFSWPNEMKAGAGVSALNFSAGVGAKPCPGALVTDDNGASDAIPGAVVALGNPVSGGAGSENFGYEMWIRTVGTPSDPTIVYTYDSQPGGQSWHKLQINSAGQLIIVTYHSVGPANYTSPPSAKVVTDGNWHHVMVQRFNSAAWNVFIDGAAAISGAASNSTTSMKGCLWIQLGINQMPMQVDEAASFAGLVSTADYVARWTEGRGRWGMASTGARINTVLDTISWPAALRDIDAGTEMMDAVTEASTQSSSGAGSTGGLLARVSALDHMQVCADVEGGLLYVSRDGKVTFRQRTNLPAAIEATYGESETPYAAPPVATTDKATVVNEVALTASRSSQVLAIDAASQTKYGIQTQSVQVPMAPDAVRAQAKAQRIVDSRATPIERQSALTLDLLTTGGAIAALGHELASGARVRRRPGVTAMRSADVAVAGLVHHITPESWDLTIDLGPRYVGPVVSARWQGRAQSVPSAVATAVPMYDRWWDDAGAASTTNPTRLVVTDPGVYMVVANAGIGGASPACAIRLNGGASLAWQWLTAGSPAGASRTLWRCSPGDYFELLLYQASGAAQAVTVYSAYSPNLSLARLGD